MWKVRPIVSAGAMDRYIFTTARTRMVYSLFILIAVITSYMRQHPHPLIQHLHIEEYKIP
jgi:hypothetical protein